MSGNNKHKILFVSHWALRMAGAEISLLDLMSEAVKRADVFLVCSEGGMLTGKAKDLGVTCKVISCDKNMKNLRRKFLFFNIITNFGVLINYLLFVWKLSRHVSELRPDIIHANVPKSHIATAVLRFAGYKGLLIFHIREIFDRRSFTAFLYWFLMFGKKVHIIAISHAVKDALPKRLRKLTVVLYNGVRVESRSIRNSVEEKLKFLYLGRIVPWKGCHLIIDAFFGLFLKLGEKAGTLDLVGDTIYWNESYRTDLLEKIYRYNICDKVQVLPHTENPYQMYYSHDVLCMGSDREPFGRVAAEAMGCGLPVISFDSGGVTEVVKDGVTGFLAGQNDIKAYTDNMMKFVEDPLLSISMGKKGVEIVKKNFNVQISSINTIDFMISCLELSRK